MATGPEHYRAAEECLGRLKSLEYGSAEAREQLAEAQAHATLAIADSLTGQRTAHVAELKPAARPPVWWLDDGQDNVHPDLYESRGAAVDEAERQYKSDNPFVDVHSFWVPVQDENEASQLVVDGRETGIFVRCVRPRTMADVTVAD